MFFMLFFIIDKVNGSMVGQASVDGAVAGRVSRDTHLGISRYTSVVLGYSCGYPRIHI